MAELEHGGTLPRIVAVLVAPALTWALLSPVGAFHHIVRLGVFGYAFLDAESPGPFETQGDLAPFQWTG